MHRHNDAIVVTTTVANNIVRHILIDNSSAVDIIFKSALDCMKLDGVRPALVKTPLYEFSGEKVCTEGSIDLPVTFGTRGDMEVTRIVTFLIVDEPVTYNIIIGHNVGLSLNDEISH